MHCQITSRGYVLLASLLTAALPIQADEAILIGGGHDVHSTKMQNELSVRWIQNVINNQEIPSNIWFTDGTEAGADVHYLATDEEAKHELMPLARVFGNATIDRHRYRENEFDSVYGSTRLNDLAPALTTKFETTTDQPVLFIFSGLGSPTANRPAGVSMKLWDNTALSTTQLNTLLGERTSPFRFVMNQCYSGGFHSLAFKNPDEGLELASGPRCGFTAQSAWQKPESCHEGLGTDDNEDYNSSFFAALSGFERNGEMVDSDPDTDANGVTSLREAHFFTLTRTGSVDLPRSTSEHYLNNWQPWYLRWLPPGPTLPNNEYAKLFRDVSVKLGIELDSSVGQILRGQLRTLQNSQKEATTKQLTAIEQLQNTRTILQDSTLSHWPALKGPYSGAFIAMASKGQLGDVAAFLGSHELYEKMLAQQKLVDSLASEIKALEHQVAQRQKLFYLRRLAVLKEQLKLHGSAREQADYLSLVTCEETPLHGID
ncbi:MAG: hypothetical protein V3U76_01845 [Granulosicoccus sp.]